MCLKKLNFPLLEKEICKPYLWNNFALVYWVIDASITLNFVDKCISWPVIICQEDNDLIFFSLSKEILNWEVFIQLKCVLHLPKYRTSNFNTTYNKSRWKLFVVPHLQFRIIYSNLDTVIFSNWYFLEIFIQHIISDQLLATTEAWQNHSTTCFGRILFLPHNINILFFEFYWTYLNRKWFVSWLYSRGHALCW